MTSKEISAALREVLEDAPSQGGERRYLTAYQILQRLDRGLQAAISSEHGGAIGKGAKTRHTPVVSVSLAVARLPDDIEKAWLSTEGMKFPGSNEEVQGGSPVCRIYRLRIASRSTN